MTEDRRLEPVAAGPDSGLRLTVRRDRRAVREAARAALAAELGPPPERPDVVALDRMHFAVAGLVGPVDARRLRRRLRSVDGVDMVQLRDDGSGVLSVRDGQLTPTELAYLVRSEGFECAVREEEQARSDDPTARRALLTVLPALITVVGALLTRDLGLGSGLVRRVSTNVELLLLALVWWFGRHLVLDVVNEWTARTAARQAPLALAAVLATVGGLWAFFAQSEPYFDVAASVVAGFHLCAWIEARLERRAARHLGALRAAWPTWVRVRRGGEDFEVRPRDVLSDDVVVVAGGLVPVDGQVVACDGDDELVSGSVVDEGLLTGAGSRVQKQVGDWVWAGSKVISGQMHVAPRAAGKDTRLGRIVQTLSAARETRAPVQRRGDRLAAAVTPLSLAVAVGAAVGWQITVPAGAFWGAIAPAVAVLVAMTPWALSAASLVPVTAAVSAAARRGVLVPDAATVEALRRMDALILARRGVLTVGRPEVERFESLGELPPEEALRIVLALERRTDDSLGEAITAYAAAEYPELDHEALPEATSFRRIPGQGVMAQVDGREVALGTGALAEARCGAAPEEGPQAGLSLFLSVDGALQARLEVFDPVREEAGSALERVRHHGVRPFLATSARSPQACALAEHVGIPIDDVRSDMDAEGREQFARVLSAAGLRVALLRPGAVDAIEGGTLQVPGVPGRESGTTTALTKASSGRGSAVKGSAAKGSSARGSEVAVLRPGAAPIAAALDIGHFAFDVIRENLALGSLALLAGLPAAIGLLPPQAAVALLIATVLLTGLNGLRLSGD